jgi:hypothetical protein
MTRREEVYAGITMAYLHRCTSEGSAFFAEILTQPKPGSIAESSLKDKDLLEPLLMAGMYLQVALDHYQTVQSVERQGRAIRRIVNTLDRYVGEVESQGRALARLEARSKEVPPNDSAPS